MPQVLLSMEVITNGTELQTVRIVKINLRVQLLQVWKGDSLQEEVKEALTICPVILDLVVQDYQLRIWGVKVKIIRVQYRI